MATEQSPRGQPNAAAQAVTVEAPDGVLATTGEELAGADQMGADQRLVAAYEEDKDVDHRFPAD